MMTRERITLKELEILDAYEFWDDDDISTERLLALICDECDCDVDEVVAVLSKYKEV